MANYLHEQLAGEVLRGTANIYWRNFLQLYGMYLLPTFPFLLLKLKILESGQPNIFTCCGLQYGRWLRLSLLRCSQWAFQSRHAPDYDYRGGGRALSTSFIALWFLTTSSS